MDIAITQNADGTGTVTIVGVPITPYAAPVVSAAPPVSAQPAPNSGVTVTGSLADGTAVNLALQPGQRVPLVAGKIVGSAVYHADGRSVCIENCYAGTTADLVGHFTIVAGGKTLFDGDLTIWCYARTRPFWINAPAVNASADLSMFAPLGPASAQPSMYDAYTKADNSPMGCGLIYPSFGATGERPDLGPLPQWDSAWLVNPSAENAQVVRGQADACAVFPAHVIDPKTNKMLLVTDYPQASFNGTGKIGNPIVTFTSATPYKMSQAQAHASMFAALASAIYGTEYDKEELALWANYYGSLWQSAGYRFDDGMCQTAHCQTRGVARCLVMLIYAAKLTDYKALFENWISELLADLVARQAPGLPQYYYPVAGGGQSPWLQYYLMFALGLAIQNGYTAAQPVLDWLAQFAFSAVLDAPHEMATLYRVGYQDATGKLAPDYLSALNIEALTNTEVAAAMKCAENSQAMQVALGYPNNSPGDFAGNPGAADNFVAMLRTGLAMAKSYCADQARASAAWTKYLAHEKCDFSGNPKYDIATRAA